MIFPTEDNFERVPTLYMPTDVQRSIRHCACVEYHPLPTLRNRFCHNPSGLEAALAMVTCNWKDHPDTCVEETSDGNICITKDFSLHVSLSTSWSIPSSVFSLGS